MCAAGAILRGRRVNGIRTHKTTMTRLSPPHTSLAAEPATPAFAAPPQAVRRANGADGAATARTGAAVRRLPKESPRAPYARHSMQWRPEHGGLPFYLRTRNPVLSMKGLPQLWRACTEAGATGTGAWTPPAAHAPAEVQRAAIAQLLDYIGLLLQEGSDEESLSGSLAFTQPPGASPSLCACMLPRVAAIRRTPHIRRTPDGYLLITIGRTSTGAPIQERVHRIVMWAMHGPPPKRVSDPVCMHMCDHRGLKCLNAEHLLWGERVANAGGGRRNGAAAVVEAAKQGRRAKRCAPVIPRTCRRWCIGRMV